MVYDPLLYIFFYIFFAFISYFIVKSAVKIGILEAIEVLNKSTLSKTDIQKMIEENIKNKQDERL